MKPTVKAENGVEAMDSFSLDDFGTEDMEAIDAVEEKALKSEIKVSRNKVGYSHVELG